MSSALSAGPAKKSRWPTLLWSYALIAPAMAFILTSLDRGYQTDLWHHLARGREIVQTRKILSEDVFTYTVPGTPLVDNNWLTQIAAYGVYRLGGLDLVQTGNSVLLALTIAGLVSIGMKQGSPARVAGLIAVAAVVGLTATMAIRPQTVSMGLFVLLLAVLIDAQQNARRLLYVPFILALWANVHGAFPIGLVLIGCFTLGAWIDTVRHLRGRGPSAVGMTFTLLVSALATLANPYGWRVYEYVRYTSTRATGRVIQEWMRPDVFTFQGAFWIASVIAMLALAIVGRRQVRMWLAIVVIVFAVVSCTSVRMSIWWYLSAAPLAMIIWPRRIDRPAKPSLAAAVLYGLIIAAMAICLPALERFNPVFKYRSIDRPEAHLQQLSDAIAWNAPGSKVFSRLEWGEYESFALPWKNAIFMDGRIEIYPDPLWDDYRQITSAAAGWDDLLDRYGVTVLLLDRHYHDGLIAAARNSPRWREELTIGGGVIFTRDR